VLLRVLRYAGLCCAVLRCAALCCAVLRCAALCCLYCSGSCGCTALATGLPLRWGLRGDAAQGE